VQNIVPEKVTQEEWGSAADCKDPIYSYLRAQDRLSRIYPIEKGKGEENLSHLAELRDDGLFSADHRGVMRRAKNVAGKKNIVSIRIVFCDFAVLRSHSVSFYAKRLDT
jgi:hypothetical protein